VPKLWNQTIEAHRREVRDAILDTTAALVSANGLRAVTMSQIAEQTGIGRATLYKYFPDVDTILRTWHEREISRHLAQLAEVRDHAGEGGHRLEAVLEAYALIAHQTRRHSDPEVVTFLHQDDHLVEAQQHLYDLVKQLIADGAKRGEVREDVAPDELATYSLHALAAATSLPSETAVRRLAKVTLAGLRPPR
jgi:AcrR family transcriptional regulator